MVILLRAVYWERNAVCLIEMMVAKGWLHLIPAPGSRGTGCSCAFAFENTQSFVIHVPLLENGKDCFAAEPGAG
jgi:2-succinyl-5-enolpyruvyl-6-hydroxy-3-cyclohexene-1-carboxylate synthase